MRGWRVNKWFIVVPSVIVIMIIVAVVLFLIVPPPVLPKTVTKQYPATVLVPGSGFGEVSHDSAKYDSSQKLLTFKVSYLGTSMVISEQPTPDSFVDIPQVYDKLTEQMQEYAKFEVNIGTIHLTKPKDLGGKEAAVLNTKGTLLFAKLDQNLTDDQWRIFFSHFRVLQ